MALTHKIISPICLVFCTTLLFSFPAPSIAEKEVSAQALDSAQKKRKSRRTPALREAVYKKLSSIQNLIEKQNYHEARSALNALLNQKNLNSYEKAQALNLRAFVLYTIEQYSKAIQAYELLLQQEALPLALELNTLFTLAQLNAINEEYTKALTFLNQWFLLSEHPSASAFALRAQLEYQVGNKKTALNNIQQAIDLYNSQQKTPEEAWWLLLRAIYFDDENFHAMIDVMKNLVKWYPKSEYWQQLANLYGQTEQADKQLQTLDSAYLKGYINNKQSLIQLVSLLITKGTPYRAGKILQRSIDEGIIDKNEKNWRLLATAWYNAKEMDLAIAAMEKAALLSKRNQPYLQLANLYLSKDRYREAIKAAEQGLQKKSTPINKNQTIKFNTLLGTAHFYLHEYDKAIAAFEAAHDKALEQGEDTTYLSQWLKHSQQEKARYQLVKDYL